MSKVSIIIPSFNEPHLNQTVRDLLKKAKGKIEIFINLDGEMPKKLVKDKRIFYTHHPNPIGMRAGINLGLKRAKSEFIMKTDAHCLFAKGFDEILKKDCQENWLMIPRRYSLNAAGWKRELRMPAKDYSYLCYPQPWRHHRYCMVPADWWRRTAERAKKAQYKIDDTMAFQGSCWFAHRDYFMKKVGYLDEKNYGPFGGEQVEVGLKYWLGGGEIKVNKNTWYAHLFKSNRFYRANQRLWYSKQKLLHQANYTWIAQHWVNDLEPGMKHKFAWLVEKFWPVPGWPEDRKLWRVPPETPLCRLAFEYGTGKCPQIRHGYTPYYYRLFKDRRQEIKKVLEMGVGLKNGASLRMWRDFFPQAQVYGADNNPQTMMAGYKVKTFLCDLTKEKEIKRLVKQVGSDIDLFVDDADHIRNHQVFLAKTILPLLKDEVIYIIEDVVYPDYIKRHLSDYDCEVIEFNKSYRDDRLVIVRKKKAKNEPA